MGEVMLLKMEAAVPVSNFNLAGRISLLQADMQQNRLVLENFLITIRNWREGGAWSLVCKLRQR